MGVAGGANHFLEQKSFFLVKLEILSEFVVLVVNWATVVIKNKFVSTVLNCKIFHIFDITQNTTHINMYLYWGHSVGMSLGKGSKRIRQQKMT